MSVAKNFIYNSIYQIIGIIMPIITVPYVSRVLGTGGVGKYAYTNANAQYFILIGMVGLSMYSSRQIAYVRDDQEKLEKTFWELNIIRFITTGIALILYILIFLVLNKQDRLIYAFQGLNILAAVFDISWFFIGIENFKKTITRNIITKVLGVALIFLLVKNKNQVVIYVLILSASQLIGQLIMWVNIPKFRFSFINNKANLYVHLMASFKLFVPQLAIQVYTLLDKTMLGWVKGDSEVGIYDNSQKTIKIALALLTSLATVMLPNMSNSFIKGNISKFKESVKKAFSFTSFMAFPMTFGLIGIAHNFVPWFYGKDFSGIEYLFYIGAWIMISISWSSVLGIQVMIAMGKENLYTISVTIAAIINFILNLILIPKLASAGTTISTTVAEISGTIIQLYLLRKFIDIRGLFQGVAKYIFGSSIMLVGIIFTDRFLQPNLVSTFIQILVGGVIYVGTMIFFKDINIIYVMKKLNMTKYLKFFNHKDV
ncbi:flippase [Clostridium sp. 19966]|uniref:flippase n=1 Tax=Clostridium sp. 19966 TaxID=2768166 RepID=UPI0028DF7982|nr:flippase [Clostridium sp. 19966]MDT8716125.1 flippase [Clostridium sp. 19966]